MTHLSRWLSTVLAVCILINTIPLASFAQESGEEELLLVEDSLLVEEESEPSEPESEPSEPESEPSEPESEPSEPVTASEEELVLASEMVEAVALSYSDQAAAFAQVLTDNGFDPSNVLTEGADGTVTLTVGENGQQVLVLLSQQDAALYQNWTISFSVSGSITIPDEFAGLGSEAAPFAGKWISSSSITMVLSTTLFQALDAGAYLSNVNISWIGPSSKPILANTLVADTEGHEITMPLTSASSFSPYIGKLVKAEQVEAAGVITLPALTYSSSDNPVLYPGHAGLACGEMEPGTKLKLTALTAPAITLKADTDAGSLVGCMGVGAELEISGPLELTATLSGQNVGGLVGSMDTDANLTIASPVTLNTTVASGSVNGGGLVGSLTNGSIQLNDDVELLASNGSVTGAAGGIAGVVTTKTGPLTGSGNVTMQSVTAHGTKNAGVLYGDCTVSGAFSPLNQIALPGDAYTVKGASSGGVFGTLKLEGDGRCELTGSNTPLTTFPGGTTNFGGVVGTLTGKRQNALVITDFTVSSEFTGQQDNTYASYPTFYGGLAAIQGEDVTMDVKSTTVSIKNVKTSSTSANPKTSAYAGLTAYVSDRALLMAEDVTVKLSNYGTDHCGGGVAGYTGKGSIVYLKDSLDLSECPLITKQNSGQLVAYQDCSLIYGPGVSISRYSGGLQLDDIGNYGELYRLSGFLTIGTDYQHSFSKVLSGSPYTLSDAADYACLALAWQSRGCFSTIQGIDTSNWSTTLKSCSIQLGADIVLTGTGIGGLSRDVASDYDTFSGILNGRDHTITLDIGAANPSEGKGDGRIYWHNAPGLFAVLSGGATVTGLTLDGRIRISNERTSPMYCGALAARLNCSAAGGTPLGTGVTTATEIDVLCTGTNTLYVGGLIGNAYGTTATTLNLDSPQAAIITSATSGNSYHFGGVIGAIEKNTPLSINCQGTTLGGSIIAGSDKDLYAGALLGTAFPSSGGAKRTITLDGVNVNDFTLTGSSSTRMSGILGGIWANTDVVMDGLTVTNTQLNALGAAKLGGLVYRASGKWTVNSADLSGLAINASSAAALGLLVCQGGAGKEPINGSDQNVGGLYLEVPVYWEDAYKVPTLTNANFNGDVFDEFVAYTAYQSSGGYQITYSGSGIISLTTANGSVNMVDGERNTYVNRTDVGTAKQTNAYSRYYYNLPQVMASCDGGAVDTPRELLIWSVCRYAEPTLRTYFTNGEALAGVTTIGSETGPADFNMVGLSYYPIRVVNSDITVKNANIKFYNQQIENLEVGNKSTRGSTQHYTMHCGLFLDFAADDATGNNYIMTVNGVSFDGTVGKVNGQSGALVCGVVKGGQYGANTSVCTVVLGESDNEANAVTLSGIRVDSTEEYRPVLIGKMGNYISLKANYIAAAHTTDAGSSLIGDVGTPSATSVSLEFAGTIVLPFGTSDGVFTRATLLNSLSYKIGSATYRFRRDKGEADNATFGYELGWNEKTPISVEYAGKQGWYDGAPSGGSDELVIRENFNFGDCLPYVWCSPAYPRDGVSVSGMHELAVNIPSINLVDGCGTYGHPYLINAEQLEVIATFINTGSATNDWQVRVPKANDNTYHTAVDQYDVIATYDSASGWEVEDGLSDVRKHLATAYYQIDSSIELDGFKGIGVEDYPFAGVISGKNSDASVTLTGNATGFINYSYGSVVRNLTVNLNQTLSIDSAAPIMGTDASGKNIRVAEQAPSNFFGGVIGCVLGGDNILDGVTVEGGEGISATGDYAHLVPIGGFVGVIAGGGVIFRGTCTGGISADNPNLLYRNPIIGRVLGGFAFRESDGAVADNGDKNYMINTLFAPGGALSWDGSSKTLTVNNGEGLLILSAIVSSGAGSTASNAYAKGTARLASYNKIGEPDGEADRNLDTGVPYLLSKTGISGAEICGSGTEGITLSFAKDAIFNMFGYGNGYRGLSARYVSNAGFVGSDLTPYSVVMRVKRFNGNGATVRGIHMQVTEYDNDDFHAASMGGIFNIVWTKKNGGGTESSIFAQNLTLDSCTVTLDYVNTSGIPQKQADTATFKDNDGLSCVAVGGFAGSASDIDVGVNMGNTSNNYLLTELHITDSVITGPNSAGGIIGATAMTNAGLTGCPGKLLSNSKYAQFGPSFLNCSYSDTNVTAKLAAGGLAGEVFAYGNGNIPMFRSLGIDATNDNRGCYATCSVDREMTLGSNSHILTTATGSLSSGVFGAVGMRARFNNSQAADKTGLSIPTSGFQTIRLEQVTVEAKTTDGKILASDGKENTCDSNSTTAAAGCVARIGSVNPVYFHNVSLTNCRIYTENVTNGYAGGIVASGYTNTTISVYDTAIKNTTIIGQNAGGLVGLVKQRGTSTLNAVNCVVLDSDIRGRTSVGGITGLGYYNSVFFNILIKDTSVCKINTSDSVVESDTKYAGRLIGQTGDTLMLSAAGISVVKTPDSNAVIPAWDVGSGTSGTATTNYGTGGYVAYADYSGLENPAYNPSFSLKTGQTTEIPLTGDAVGKIHEDSYGSVAARILADHKSDAQGKKNLAPYPSTPYTSNAAAIAGTGWAPQISTFKAEQKYADDQWPYADLPVLLLKGKNSGRGDIESYLDLITNGAYSDANVPKSLNVTVYSYDPNTHLFTEKTQDDGTHSVYLLNENIQVRKSCFDNTRNRFSLVEVTFTVNTKEAGKSASSYTYTVSVPVMVIRELQFVYSTTFSYGTEFHPAAYQNLKYHVLESTDVPFSAYLTLQYNRDASQYSEYGWEDLINEGSDAFLKIDKILQFDNSGDPMPVGTKLTLLDCRNGNKAYYYQAEDGATDIPFSSFKDSAGHPFQSSMADVLGVTLTLNDSGQFVETNQEDATILLGGKYYRLWKEGDGTDCQRFDLTVPDFSEMDKEDMPKENYLLVMEVPDQGDSFSLNGQLHIGLNDVIASTGTPIHRSPEATTIPGDNDEFSYLIFSGYRQGLESLNDPGTFNLPQNPGENDPVMMFHLKDTITFSNKQAYNSQDHLYLKFMATLQKHEGSETEDCQFPAGTSGTVSFYVQNVEGKYFTLDDNRNWNTVPVDSETKAVSYPWVSDGNNMELRLSLDGTEDKLLDLAEVRQAVKGSKQDGDSDIIVTAEMEVDFSKLSADAFEKTIPASENNGTDNYVQLYYQAQLSTQIASLSYSNAKAVKEDPVKYYRAVKYQAILSMDAREINQLGVNPLAPEPQYLSNDRKTSRIDLTALLDLGGLENPKEVLSNTESITFKLSLERRQDGSGGLDYEPVSNGGDFISFDGWSYQNDENFWWREIQPSQFDGERFSMDITAHVSMLPRNYANYLIRLEAKFTGSSPDINSDEAYVVYTYACIDPSFYEPLGG